MADDLLRHPAGQGVAGDAGERVRAPALKGEAQRAGRLRGAPSGGHLGQPACDERRRAFDLLSVSPLDAEECMRHMVERIVATLHESTHVGVRVRAGAVVDCEHGARVGVHHESREHPQHVVDVVRAAGAAAFGVSHHDHAVEVGRSPGRGPFHDPAHESVGTGGSGEHHHEVAGADPPPARTAKAVEGRAGVGALDLPARRERCRVELEGLDGVREVGGRGQFEADVAFRQRGQDLIVADILPGAEGACRDAERESPRGETSASWNRCADEPVPFEDGVGKAKTMLPVRDGGTCLEAARRDRDIVFRRRHAGYLGEFETIGHRVFSGSVRSMWHGHGHCRGSAGLG